MPDRKNRKREAPISYRPPKGLRQEFHARVEKSGLSTSAFITKSVFATDPPRQSRRPSMEAELLARLLGQAAKIRDELHEISLTGSDDNAPVIEAAFDELTEIRAALLKASGRKP